MKFSTREDIDAPAEAVFDALSDFDAISRAGMQRGIEVRRTDRLEAAGVGMSWQVGFDWRGKRREVMGMLHHYEPPHQMRFEAESPTFALTLILTLVALSKKRTRLGVELEIRPKTLAARLMIQSMKLGKANLSRRFSARVRTLATTIEQRQRRGPA